MTTRSERNNWSWVSLTLGAFCLGIALYSTAAPSMNDGDIGTPTWLFNFATTINSPGEIDEPVTTSISPFLVPDRNKRFVLSIVSSFLALSTLITALVARYKRQHSLGYSVGILSAAAAASLIGPLLFLGFALGAAAILALGGSRGQHA